LKRRSRARDEDRLYEWARVGVIIRMSRDGTSETVVQRVKFIAWLIAVLTAGYTLPWAIAVQRSRGDAGKVLLINLLLGWTIVGWVWALVVSLAE